MNNILPDISKLRESSKKCDPGAFSDQLYKFLVRKEQITDDERHETIKYISDFGDCKCKSKPKLPMTTPEVKKEEKKELELQLFTMGQKDVDKIKEAIHVRPQQLKPPQVPQVPKEEEKPYVYKGDRIIIPTNLSKEIRKMSNIAPTARLLPKKPSLNIMTREAVYNHYENKTKEAKDKGFKSLDDRLEDDAIKGGFKSLADKLDADAKKFGLASGQEYLDKISRDSKFKDYNQSKIFFKRQEDLASAIEKSEFTVVSDIPKSMLLQNVQPVVIQVDTVQKKKDRIDKL